MLVPLAFLLSRELGCSDTAALLVASMVLLDGACLVESISPLYLHYISPVSPLYLPIYLPYISPISPHQAARSSGGSSWSARSSALSGGGAKSTSELTKRSAASAASVCGGGAPS